MYVTAVKGKLLAGTYAKRKKQLREFYEAISQDPKAYATEIQLL